MAEEAKRAASGAGDAAAAKKKAKADEAAKKLAAAEEELIAARLAIDANPVRDLTQPSLGWLYTVAAAAPGMESPSCLPPIRVCEWEPRVGASSRLGFGSSHEHP